MTSPRWTRLPVLSVLVLVLVLTRSALTARSDRNMVSEENVSATVNATVLDRRGNTIHVMSSDDGTYGQNSPKVDTRGVVIAPAPHHGGSDITAHLSSHHATFDHRWLLVFPVSFTCVSLIWFCPPVWQIGINTSIPMSPCCRCHGEEPTQSVVNPKCVID